MLSHFSQAEPPNNRREKLPHFSCLWRSSELPFVCVAEGGFFRFHLHNFGAHFKALLLCSHSHNGEESEKFLHQSALKHHIHEPLRKIDQHNCASKMICFRFRSFLSKLLSRIRMKTQIEFKIETIEESNVPLNEEFGLRIVRWW